MSLYFQGKKTALLGPFDLMSAEEYGYVVERLGGTVVAEIGPDTDNVIIGGGLSGKDYSALEAMRPHLFLLSEYKIDDYIQDVKLADDVIGFHDLAMGATPPEIIGEVF